MAIGRTLTEPEVRQKSLTNSLKMSHSPFTQYDLEQQLGLFIREEVIVWHAMNNRPMPAEPQIKQATAAVVDDIVGKAELMSCRMEREGAVCRLCYISGDTLLTTLSLDQLPRRTKLPYQCGSERGNPHLQCLESPTSLAHGGAVAPMVVEPFLSSSWLSFSSRFRTPAIESVLYPLSLPTLCCFSFHCCR